MDFVNKFEVYLDKEKKVSATTLSAYMSDIQDFQLFLQGRGKLLEKAGNADVAASYCGRKYFLRLTPQNKSWFY